MLTGLRVLVIEREILIALDVQRVLETEGAAEVVLARTPADAVVGMIGPGTYDLALIDAQMGAPEVVRLVEALRSAGVPVVLTSADGTIVSQFRANAFVEKPFTEVDLVAACVSALGAGRQA